MRVEGIVVGDLILLQAGDQVVADGRLEDASDLSLDESILTGESDPIGKSTGDEARAGSFAAEGAGAYRVEAVGAGSYAARVTGEARAFRHPRTPLERALNRLLFALVGVMVPLGVLLRLALWEREAPVDEAVPTSAAAVVSLVPEGLILLTSLTYAVAALRMARRGALAQQLNAIESLASVDVICLDKTGTLTEPELRGVALVPGPETEVEELARAFARYAASAPSGNTTLAAVARAYPARAEVVEEHVSFSSPRRWSALRLGDVAYVFGAPELFPLGGLAGPAEHHAGNGRRVLALGAAGALPRHDELPADLAPLGLVGLAEPLRGDARSTVESFRTQGVELKVISGDAPETVAAIARDAGIAATRTAARRPPPPRRRGWRPSARSATPR